jgi:hypothetical protein
MKDFKISPMDFISTPTNAVADLCPLHNLVRQQQDLGPAALNAFRAFHVYFGCESETSSILSGEYTHLF